ncbi:MAG: hypothetical protein AAGI49_02625 [Bacteroidota bacterium]
MPEDRATSMLGKSLRTETQISTYFSLKNKLKFVFPSIKNLWAYLLRDLKHFAQFQKFSKAVTTMECDILPFIRIFYGMLSVD